MAGLSPAESGLGSEVAALLEIQGLTRSENADLGRRSQVVNLAKTQATRQVSRFRTLQWMQWRPTLILFEHWRKLLWNSHRLNSPGSEA